MGDLISQKALIEAIDKREELVRHSKWVCRIPGVFSCGACKGLAIGNRPTYYCPECGAKMDGGGD